MSLSTALPTVPAIHPMNGVIPRLEPIYFQAAPAVSRIRTTIDGDWTKQLPVLAGRRLTMRELLPSDAGSLLSMLSTAEVAKFISPPPTTLQAFEKFVRWTIGERQAGRQFTFGIVPEGCDHAVGIVQVRAIGPQFSVAEWGFALGSAYWGTGLFVAGARMALDFAFECASVHRVEARAAVGNARGNGVLRKLGAVHEGRLRSSLLKDGRYLDQFMWSIVANDWMRAKAIWSEVVA
jgi:RimJ/RimL family protein N-acetyltransferase